jgi:hypothetical protein
MELLDAVRSALPPDPTPWMIVATLLVILALGREVEPRRIRHAVDRAEVSLSRRAR